MRLRRMTTTTWQRELMLGGLRSFLLCLWHTVKRFQSLPSVHILSMQIWVAFFPITEMLIDQDDPFRNLMEVFVHDYWFQFQMTYSRSSPKTPSKLCLNSCNYSETSIDSLNREVWAYPHEMKFVSGKSTVLFCLKETACSSSSYTFYSSGIKECQQLLDRSICCCFNFISR